MRRRLLALVTFSVFALPVVGQQCPQAPVLGPSKEVNLFNEEQESYLGDIFADRLASSLHVIEDPEIAGYLDRIGQRLLAQMPASKLRFRFYVVDSPDANAFAIAGGRVYVTRKLIAMVHSEDELAGVLAHELGHQLAHHTALDWSRIFRDVLKVDKVGDRADIENRYNLVLDTYAVKQDAIRAASRGHNDEQTGADQVGVYALARAGYAPSAIADFWDRFAETKGKKGSWLSDLFGTSVPESKRLREMVKNLGVIPAACKEATAASASDDFLRWQTRVKTYSGFGKKEALHNVEFRRSLSPYLRGDVDEFRFSPDGAYVLAQDASNIFVLQREPLSVLFRIPAPGARKAQFSPDSKQVVFYNEGLRIERWNIAERRVEDIHETHIYGGCVQTRLSPDGAYLACLRANRETFFPLDLQLFDLASDTAIVTKKGFAGPATPSLAAIFLLIELRSGREMMAMAFSPDGRYFVAGDNASHLLVDLQARAEIPMPAPLRKLTSYEFAFVGPDRIAGADNMSCENISVAKFPSGDVLDRDIHIGGRSIYSVSHGDYLLVRPLTKAPVGILDLKAKRVFVGSKTDAIDIYDGEFVNERVNGEIGFYREAGKEPVATVTLPRAPLSRVSAAIVSADLRQLALSERTRGAVWDLASGDRLLYVPGFRGAWFDSNDVLLDFAPLNQFRTVATMSDNAEEVRKNDLQQPGHTIGIGNLTARNVNVLSQVLKRTDVQQIGRVVLTITPQTDSEPHKNLRLEAHDARTFAVLWSREYPKAAPHIYGRNGDDYIVLCWILGSKEAREQLKEDPEAKRLMALAKDVEGSYLIEIADPQTGKSVSKFIIATSRASFSITHLRATASTLLAIDTNHRVTLYSLKGEQKGRMFGGYAVLSSDGSKLAIEREPGRLLLYDAATLKEADEFTFGGEIVTAQFSSDAKRLFILTDDETAIVLNLAGGKADASTVSAK